MAPKYHGERIKPPFMIRRGPDDLGRMTPYPLGRKIEHDSRSRRFVAHAIPRDLLVSKQWERMIPVWDQGLLGSCTGNAALGACGTQPLFSALVSDDLPDPIWTEDTAVAVYSQATQLDTFPGTYPPQDTGSSGLAAAKALLQMHYISGYTHAFDIDAALTALQNGPVITGVNWYEGFDTPDEDGLVRVDGEVRGGHEFIVDGIDVDNKLVWATNSWGPTWGVRGRFCFSWDDWERLLQEDGDVTVLVPVTLPPPQPEPEPPVEPNWFSRFIDALLKWLRGLLGR